MHYLTTSALVISLLFTNVIWSQNSESVYSENVGKIVFSTERLSRGEESNWNLKTEFKGDESIYGRCFWEKPLNQYETKSTLAYKELYYSNSSSTSRNYEGGMIIKLRVSPEGCSDTTIVKPKGAKLLIYEKKYGEWKDPVYPASDCQDFYTVEQSYFYGTMEDLTSYQVLVKSDPSDSDIDDSFSREWSKIYNELAIGRHRIDVIMHAYNARSGSSPYMSEEPIATGSFYVTKEDAQEIQTGIKFSSLEEGMSDPQLEEKILKAAIKHGKANGWQETFLEAKIESEDWIIYRNELTGIVISRGVSAWILSKRGSGKCFYQDFGFRQDFDGVGYQNSVYLYGIGNPLECDCPED